LIVGAPAHTIYESKLFNAGKVYAYEILSNGSCEWIFSITGNTLFSALGSSFWSGHPFDNDSTIFGISSPTATSYPDIRQLDQAGTVTLIDFSKPLEGNFSIDELEQITLFEANEAFARLGLVVLISDLNKDGLDDLWISEPFRNTENGGVDAGAGYMWLGGSTFPKGTVSNCHDSSDLCFSSSKTRSLYTKSVEILDFNGNGKWDIALGGPRDYSTAYMAGSVSILFDPFD